MAKRVTLYSPAGKKYPDLPPTVAAQLRAYGYSEKNPARKKPAAEAPPPVKPTAGGSDGS